ncbi:SDR family NAD(P)-dependent oxidoreductase [Mycoplasma todarodis]|uniref:Short-chain dehydrogenase n=1 Tax=Mycoplasma todarodis TaxID=1937191 RepID=A0A4V2NIC4_9MOLU|nr:SDR family oxidoreductase [Mycoplasma todarodis]TCG11832.1 hypothetical protein C4B25_00745 [Mycoplasma todarodis]
MKKIFIIGGSSGIGEEIIKQFSGAEIWNFSRNTSLIAQKNVEFDLMEDLAYEKFSNIVFEEKPNILIFNAGIGDFSFIGGKSDKVQRLFQVNVLTYIKIFEAIVAYLKENKIGVLVTTSTAAYINGAGEAIYNSTKHALSAYIKSLSTELKNEKSETHITEFVMHATNSTRMTKVKATTEEKKYLEEVIAKLLIAFKNKHQQFIPRYHETYRKVFEFYNQDPIEQGIQSLEYKRKKGEK